MTANAIAVFPHIPETEQYFVLPGSYSWEQLKTLTTSLGENSNLKISYLDGKIELMTTGEKHETISRLISLLLGLYFWQNKIEFIPVGSATRESQEKAVSFAPDESYLLVGKNNILTWRSRLLSPVAMLTNWKNINACKLERFGFGNKRGSQFMSCKMLTMKRPSAMN